MIQSKAKEQLRIIYLKRRQNIKKKLVKTFSLNFRLLKFLSKYNTKIISGYFSTKNEVNIFYTLNFLKEQNTKICFPFIKNLKERLFFSFWDFNEPLEIGKFNIKVPFSKYEIEPDLLVVPLVCFDSSKYRIGYGGGYYDKTIQYLRKKKKIVAIGVSFDEQVTKKVPKNYFDQKLDFIITPTSIIK